MLEEGAVAFAPPTQKKPYTRYGSEKRVTVNRPICIDTCYTWNKFSIIILVWLFKYLTFLLRSTITFLRFKKNV